jgi:Na+-driven multidrug efflux pump
MGEEGVSSLNYCRVILDLILLTGNYAMMENLGIYGAQAYGKGDKPRIYQLFCQAAFLITVYFLLTIFPLINYSDNILGFLDFDAKMIDTIRSLQISLAPAFLLKMITDQLKTFFFSHRKFNIIGILNLIGLAIISPVIYFMSKSSQFKHSQLGWLLFGYELINILMCYFAY